MKRLVEHIEKLLLLHDCVIIPGFGGFVLQAVSSSHHVNINMFIPPRKEVAFSQSLNCSDGLLAESYMQMHNIDFNKAQLLIKNDVAQLKDMLESEGALSFGMTGMFATDGDNVVFTPTKNSDLLYSTTHCYGLPVFHFLPLQNRKQMMDAPTIIRPSVVEEDENEDEKLKNKNIPHKMPIVKTFIRASVAAAAAILLFLLISTPVEDTNNASYTASFIPQEFMPGKTADDIINEAFRNAENQKQETKNTEDDTKNVTENEAKEKIVIKTEKAETDNTVSAATTTAKSKTKTTITNPSTAKNNLNVNSDAAKKKFYVIIGSFATKAQANKFIKSLKEQEAKTVGILASDGHVRVYAQSFDTEQSANSYMLKLRQTTKHKQAWTHKM